VSSTRASGNYLISRTPEYGLGRNPGSSARRGSNKGGGCPSAFCASASHGQRPLSLRRDNRRPVRNPSAVVPTTLATSQRRQPLDLLILEASNAVNRDKRPSRLVRDEEVRRAGLEPAWALGLALDSCVWAAVSAVSAFTGPTHGLCVSLGSGAPDLIGCSSAACSCCSTVEK
jgi:hypothetical protein